MRNNLLGIKFIREIVKSKLFPSALQVINLVMFLLLLIPLGWGVADKALRYTNFTSFMVWVIWWPTIVFAVLFAARAWCTTCHLRLIAKYVGRIGLQLKVPNFIKKYGTTITLLMLLGLFFLHSSVVSYHVNHFGGLTAWYLIILLGYTIIVSLIFKKGTFCKSMCPLVAFLGPYSRMSPTELRSADKETCRNCKAKECIKNCTNNLYMGNLNNNEGCLLCFECVTNCPNDNIRFSFRPFLKDLWHTTKRSLAPAVAVVVLLGIIFEEVGEEWEIVDKATLAVPEALINLGIPGEILGGYHYLPSIWINLLFPLAIVGITALIAKALARKGSIVEYIEIYALGFVPLLFSLHLTKHWHKFNEKLGYLPYVLNDLSGVNTAAQISAKTLATPGPAFMPKTIEGWFLMALVASGLIASLYVVYKISKRSFEDEPSTGTKSMIPFFITISLTGIVFLLTIYNWFGLSN